MAIAVDMLDKISTEIVESDPVKLTNNRYSAALHEIGRMLDDDFENVSETWRLDQIRTILQAFDTYKERYCA